MQVKGEKDSCYQKLDLIQPFAARVVSGFYYITTNKQIHMAFSWQIITLQFTGKLLDAYKYAALQKMDDPSEICLSEEIPIPAIPHKKYVRKILDFL